jgi:hypothetical protein
MPVKVLEECKKEAGPVITKIDVRLTKDLAVKLESGNPAISYIGTIAAIGLLGAVLYIGYKATKKTSNSESASGLAVLVLFLAVGVGALLGYWLKGDARTMLNEVQVKDLVTSAEFQAALANSTRTTEEASRLQLRVADLERELSLARTGPRSPAPDSSIPILNALVYLGFGAILGTLLTGGVPLRRGRSALELNNALQSIRNVLNRPPASISPDPSSTNWEQHAIVAVQGILDAVLDMKSNSGSKSHAS